MPLAAFTMAALLFVYARSSIVAAKRNAQSHRAADGGQISWRNESLRRHGQLAPPEEQSSVKQILGLSKETGTSSEAGTRKGVERVEEREGKGATGGDEQRIREAARRMRAEAGKE
jgi:hypothetical protein